MGLDAHLVVVDEFAFFSATVGTKTEREKFNLAARDVAARGRKCAIWTDPGHPAALVADRGYRAAGPVRLPVRVPLHHRHILRHRARPRLGRQRLRRLADRPVGARGRRGCWPKTGCRAGSRSPTSMTARWPRSPAAPRCCGAAHDRGPGSRGLPRVGIAGLGCWRVLPSDPAHAARCRPSTWPRGDRRGLQAPGPMSPTSTAKASLTPGAMTVPFTSPAATAAKRCARPARPSTSAMPASWCARAWPVARASLSRWPRTRACSPP